MKAPAPGEESAKTEQYSGAGAGAPEPYVCAIRRCRVSTFMPLSTGMLKGRVDRQNRLAATVPRACAAHAPGNAVRVGWERWLVVVHVRTVPLLFNINKALTASRTGSAPRAQTFLFCVALEVNA